MADSEMLDAAGAETTLPHQEGVAELSIEEELDLQYPNRPHNYHNTLPFHDLFLTLFNPLNENKKKVTGPVTARKKKGPHGPSNPPPQEVRRAIIERFISRWRKEVGNDIYPAFRLIIPEKDRDRAMYGLKEKTIGKLLVKVMRINKDSEDGYNLLNWKIPGQTAASRMAGDFAGRCYEVIMKRPINTKVGNMTITEVNDLLDKLSAAQKEEQQQPIFEQFYSRMNAEELLWLIRIILRQMKVGATEKTFFDIWHPDAESLFNVSSSLRRVCWELYDPTFRLEGDHRDIALMQCFQPQLAQFQMHSIQKMVDRMKPTEDDSEFWIEEKLDGERMQLHMVSDNKIPGGKKFCFWSRKAKDYTYLYGNGLMDENSALTRHLKNAFDDGVRNIILDGEMITWDPEEDAIVPFGTLKTAALAEQRNPYSTTSQRPLYRVFDVLYLNDQVLTNFTLRDRRRALEGSVRSVHRRLEVHTYQKAHKTAEVEDILRKVVSEASEGLVLKNPRSAYRLNDRNDDWMKVKPEYMTEFGESLDCIVIGGFYGSGYRGGRLSSFLCGLKVDENQVRQGANPMKCYSFFKVGGGFTAADYANIRHQTDGKWKPWDPKHPPTEFIELGGDERQCERPDAWIRPDESVVLEVKAADTRESADYKMGFTLRFPRFKRLRTDRDWRSALSIQGFMDLKSNATKEQTEKKFLIDDGRKTRARISRKKPMTVAGSEEYFKTPYGGPATNVFAGLNFYVMSNSIAGDKKSKVELEQIIKTNGGNIFQTYKAAPNTVCVADHRVVKAASMMKTGKVDIVRPSWLFDCIKQCEADAGRPTLLLPMEPRHMLFTRPESKRGIEESIDENADSYARDVTVDELREIFDHMPQKLSPRFSAAYFRHELEQHDHHLGELPGWMFEDLLLYFDSSSSVLNGSTAHNTIISPTELRSKQARNTARFAGAHITDDLEDEGITHVVIGEDKSGLKPIRRQISGRVRLPRIVTLDWIEQSWAEKTRLDEEHFVST